MEFRKRQNDLAEPYSLSQAIKLLKEEEPLIDSIKEITGGLEIITKIIKVKNYSKYNGQFRIKLAQGKSKFIINIRRLNRNNTKDDEGYRYSDHPHAHGSSFCWGNIRYIMGELRKNKDYYWMTKLMIEYLQNEGHEE